MDKVLVILNDGTDEIYNIHAMVLQRDHLRTAIDVVDLFYSIDAIAEIMADAAEDDTELTLGKFINNIIEERTYLVVETDDPQAVMAKVEQQDSEDRVSYDEGDFKPWEDWFGSLPY